MLSEDTRRVVERYDSALKQIAELKRENRALVEHVRRNEVKVLQLISHYQQEIEERTNSLTELNDERRARELFEKKQRQRQYSDKGTNIEEGDFNSREAELEGIIYMLEDEIKDLTDKQRIQKEEFDRQTIHNQALAKKSFDENIDTLRSIATDAVTVEVADALSQLLHDNKKMSSEFHQLLGEIERLHISREELSRELNRTRRELDFMAHREKLLEQKLHAVRKERGDLDAPTTYSSEEDEMQNVRVPSSSLEDYFKESLRRCCQEE